MDPKTKKWQIEVKFTSHHFGKKINWSEPKNKTEKERSWFEGQKCKLGPMQGPAQGFNLLQMSSNWFLGMSILDAI